MDVNILDVNGNTLNTQSFKCSGSFFYEKEPVYREV